MSQPDSPGIAGADLPLGKPTTYPDRYSPQLLRGIRRSRSARALFGADYWTAHEFTWLGPGGEPRVGMLRLQVPFDSPTIVESKSLKLFLMSFAFERWAAQASVVAVIASRVGAICGATVTVQLLPLASVEFAAAGALGECIDDYAQDVAAVGSVRPLADCVVAPEIVTARWHSHLFHSLCPVTGQPDLATIVIDYRGPTLAPAALLGYLIGFRRAASFHEAVIERIYDDLVDAAGPERLQVSGLFCRRGGIDIVPVRASEPVGQWPPRLPRQ